MKEILYLVGSLSLETLNLPKSYHDASVYVFRNHIPCFNKNFLTGVPRCKSDNAVCAGRAARDYDNVTVMSHTPHFSHQRKPRRNLATDETYHSFSQSGSMTRGFRPLVP